MKKKILFIVSGLDVGGLELYTLRYAKRYYNDLDISILCKQNKGGKLEPEFDKLSIPIINQKIGYVNVANWFQFFRVLRTKRYDAVCDFTGDFAGLSLLLAYLARVPRRFVFYRGSKYQFGDSLFKTIYAKFSHILTKKFSTKILSNSEYALVKFYGKGFRKLNYAVIKNGLKTFKESKSQPKVISELPDDSFIIGHVGRYSVAKNHETILKVAKYLCDKYNHVYFLFCGKGVSENIYNLSKELGITDRLIMPGLCMDLAPWYNSMDAFIFPSTNEGQPNALLEALSFEVPTVTSDIPTIIECTPESMRGNRFNPNDTEAFIGALEKIIKGQPIYDYRSVKIWIERENDPTKRLEEFYNILNSDTH